MRYSVLLFPAFLLGAALGLLVPRLSAQAERTEAEFVRTKKAVEVLEYDVMGVKTSTWTDAVVVMRHRATGACWIGIYQKDGNLQWAPAPSPVCK